MVLIRGYGSNEQKDRQCKINKCLLILLLLVLQGKIPYAFTQLLSMAAHSSNKINRMLRLIQWTGLILDLYFLLYFHLEMGVFINFSKFITSMGSHIHNHRQNTEVLHPVGPLVLFFYTQTQ